MRFLFVAIAALAALIVHSPEPARAGELKLEAAVIFSRHGVRAPLYPNDYLDVFSDTAWPDFGVEPGELMPNGFDAAQQMGAYYGAYFRDGGLLPATGCPKAKKIWFRSDNSQRTYETAVALRNGMLPGCDYDVQSLPINVPEKPVDPLFDPVNANICTPNDTRLNLAWGASLGRSSDAVADANAYSLEALQDVLQCCQPSLCAEAGLPAGCTLLDLPSTEKILGYATNLSENFLMEYAADMSLSDVGWGRITDNNQLSFINAVHALEFYASNADAYNSRVSGSNIINVVVKRLKAAANGKGRKLSVIVGHDNNLLNLAGMFGANWLMDDYQANQVPPGAGMTFELWRSEKTGKRFVQVNFWAQTPDQLRAATPLTLAAPPDVAELSASICGTKVTEKGCQFDDFVATAKQAIYKPCVGKKPKS